MVEYQQFLVNKLESKVSEEQHTVFKKQMKKIKEEIEHEYENFKNECRLKRKVYYPYTILDQLRRDALLLWSSFLSLKLTLFNTHHSLIFFIFLYFGSSKILHLLLPTALSAVLSLFTVKMVLRFTIRVFSLTSWLDITREKTSVSTSSRKLAFLTMIAFLIFSSIWVVFMFFLKIGIWCVLKTPCSPWRNNFFIVFIKSLIVESWEWVSTNLAFR